MTAAPCLVVGAGPAGLAQARALRRAGIPFELVERHSGPGGIWDIDNPGSPMYGSARLISSKQRSAFFGHPMPRDYPDYPEHARVLSYLKDFVAAEGLLDAITFGTEVRRIEALGDGQWRASFSNRDPRTYGAVVCANGMTWDPLRPEIPGEFTGSVGHAVGYRDPDAYAGKRVLVIGGGNTGCDVASDLAQAGVETTLSLRRGYHVIPRHTLGIPADVIGAGLTWLPLPVQQGLSQTLLRLLHGDPGRRGWPRPDHRMFETHPIINSRILDLVGSGRLQIRPKVSTFVGSEAIFTDGRREGFDAVLLATGYKMTIPYLDPAHFEWRGHKIGGFLTVFNARHPTLFTLGFLATASGVFGDFDRLAHLIAQHLRDRREAPERARAFRAIVETEVPDLLGGLKVVDSPRHAAYAHNPTLRRYVDKLRRRMDWPDFPK